MTDNSDHTPTSGDRRAAGPDRESPEPTGRDRLRTALSAPWSRGQAVAGVLLALLGFAAVVQVQANDRGELFVGARQADLIALINTLSLATDRTEAEIAELQRTREALRSDAAATQTALAVAEERLTTLGMLAGVIPATGPGIRVTVESGSGTVGTDQLLNGLQELRNAGAEAIEINDEVRVVAQTGISERGGSLVVGGRSVQPPYVIEAVGDPGTLATALEFEGGFLEEVEAVGGVVHIQRLDEVEVASTVEPPDLRFAEPAEPE